MLSSPDMEAYFSLGSNLGDRRANLAAGIRLLEGHGARTLAVSPVLETPALLAPNATAAWDQPYLNLAIKCEVSGEPHAWLNHIQAIEDSLGRDRTAKWAPRPLDIDILIWGDRRWDAVDLQIPHRELTHRSFVLTPLLHIAPNLKVPCPTPASQMPITDYPTVFTLTQRVKPLPLWMAIINLTPDSFSDGGEHSNLDDLAEEVSSLARHGAHIIDFGAESTRPGAQPVCAETEWARLQPGLAVAFEVLADLPLPPRISVDTRHPSVAANALELGVGLINDVSGLETPAMRAVARSSDCEWVIMHHLGLPADPARTLPPSTDPIPTLLDWLGKRVETLATDGIDSSRLLFDPGIGFGKDSLQSLQILRNTQALRDAGIRLLVGHSRKSFMQFANVDFRDRDLETLGVSLQLCQQGVDVLRVHDAVGHMRAHRAWSHVQGYAS